MSGEDRKFSRPLSKFHDQFPLCEPTVNWDEEDCSFLLQSIERVAFSSVVSALRAKGVLTKHGTFVLDSLRKELSITEELSRAEFRRASNDERLCAIASKLNPSYDTESAWDAVGAEVPEDIVAVAPPVVFAKTSSHKAGNDLLGLIMEHNNKLAERSADMFAILTHRNDSYVPERLRKALRDTETLHSERIYPPIDVVQSPPLSASIVSPQSGSKPPAKARRKRPTKKEMEEKKANEAALAFSKIQLMQSKGANSQPHELMAHKMTSGISLPPPIPSPSNTHKDQPSTTGSMIPAENVCESGRAWQTESQNMDGANTSQMQETQTLASPENLSSAAPDEFVAMILRQERMRQAREDERALGGTTSTATAVTPTTSTGRKRKKKDEHPATPSSSRSTHSAEEEWKSMTCLREKPIEVVRELQKEAKQATLSRVVAAGRKKAEMSTIPGDVGSPSVVGASMVASAGSGNEELGDLPPTMPQVLPAPHQTPLPGQPNVSLLASPATTFTVSRPATAGAMHTITRAAQSQLQSPHSINPLLLQGSGSVVSYNIAEASGSGDSVQLPASHHTQIGQGRHTMASNSRNMETLSRKTPAPQGTSNGKPTIGVGGSGQAGPASATPSSSINLPGSQQGFPIPPNAVRNTPASASYGKPIRQHLSPVLPPFASTMIMPVGLRASGSLSTPSQPLVTSTSDPYSSSTRASFSMTSTSPFPEGLANSLKMSNRPGMPMMGPTSSGSSAGPLGYSPSTSQEMTKSIIKRARPNPPVGPTMFAGSPSPGLREVPVGCSRTPGGSTTNGLTPQPVQGSPQIVRSGLQPVGTPPGSQTMVTFRRSNQTAGPIVPPQLTTASRGSPIQHDLQRIVRLSSVRSEEPVHKVRIEDPAEISLGPSTSGMDVRTEGGGVGVVMRTEGGGAGVSVRTEGGGAGMIVRTEGGVAGPNTAKHSFSSAMDVAPAAVESHSSSTFSNRSDSSMYVEESVDDWTPSLTSLAGAGDMASTTTALSSPSVSTSAAPRFHNKEMSPVSQVVKQRMFKLVSADSSQNMMILSSPNTNGISDKHTKDRQRSEVPMSPRATADVSDSFASTTTSGGVSRTATPLDILQQSMRELD